MCWISKRLPRDRSSLLILKVEEQQLGTEANGEINSQLQMFVSGCGADVLPLTMKNVKHRSGKNE
jgi:hypothetical protein